VFCFILQLLMEYVLPFATMIKTAALPTLPPPPGLPEYGTHKVRLFSYLSFL
jgi:hypothetical protein